MKKLLSLITMTLLLAQSNNIQPFAWGEVEGPDVVENQCDGEWCSLVELAPKLKSQYQSCYYYAMQNKVNCTDYSGNVTKIEVTTSDKIELGKNFFGTYHEKRADGQLIKRYLYAQPK